MCIINVAWANITDTFKTFFISLFISTTSYIFARKKNNRNMNTNNDNPDNNNNLHIHSTRITINKTNPHLTPLC